MKEQFLCILLSINLVACSTIKEVPVNNVGEPYLSRNESKIVIRKPKIIFDNDLITIIPNISAYFEQYQNKGINEVTVEKDVSVPSLIKLGVASYLSFGIALIDNTDYNVFSTGETTTKYKGVKKIKIGEICKKAVYDNHNLLVTIESNNGKIVVPLSKDNQIHTSFEELNNPSKFTVALSYKNETEEYDIVTPELNRKIIQSIKPERFIISNNSILNSGKTPFPMQEKLSEKNSFIKINNLYNKYIEQYIATVKKPTIPKLQIFPEIPSPQLPQSPELNKSQFETKKEFQRRVEIAIDNRSKEIEKLQANYRHAVESRNTTIEQYLVQRDKEISQLIDNYNQRKIQLDTHIDTAKVKQTAYAFQEAFGAPYLDHINYDAENKTLYGTINMERSTYQEKISLQMSPLEAKYIYKHKLQTPVSLSYHFVNDEVELDKISIYKGDTEYLAQISDKEYKADDIRVVISTNKKLIKAEQLHSIDSAAEKMASLQNPNLIDEYAINAVTFVRDQESRVGKEAFNDDIPTLLKNTKQRKISKKRWLFVIGIENYQQTDNVQYSRRSAELFIQVAQKKLGISKRHTYSLIDEQATVGQIKDRMSLMLKNIKEGDDIYFYYNGHGIPDPQDNNAPYLLASDKIPDFVTDDPYFKLENFYKQLSNSKANKIVAFVDSCFSGTTDGIAIIKGVASTRLAPKNVAFDQTKMVVMSAGKKKQYSNVYLEKGNRLFSYFVMKELLNGEHQMNAIYQYVRKKVRDTSLGMGDLKLQEPSLSGNNNISI